LFSATTCTQYSTVCHGGLHNDVLLDTVFQQTKQVQCEDCTGVVGNDTIQPNFLIASVLHALVCGER